MGRLFDVWMPGLMFLAIVSMILGNIMALVQTYRRTLETSELEMRVVALEGGQ